MNWPRKNRIGNGHKQLTEETIQMAKKKNWTFLLMKEIKQFTIKNKEKDGGECEGLSMKN